jgi:hypothetical protein
MEPIIQNVWIRRLAQFFLGAIFSFLTVVGLAPYVSGHEFLGYFLLAFTAPGWIVMKLANHWGRGWATVLSALAVCVFWGLVAMVIGWGWDEWKKRKKI